MLPIQILLGGIPLNMTEAAICLAASVVLTVAFNYLLGKDWHKGVRF